MSRRFHVHIWRKPWGRSRYSILRACRCGRMRLGKMEWQQLTGTAFREAMRNRAPSTPSLTEPYRDSR